MRATTSHAAAAPRRFPSVCHETASHLRSLLAAVLPALLLAALLGACAGTVSDDAAATAASRPTAPSAAGTADLEYPPAPRSDHADTYHGVTVADPYRWLEDLSSEETRRFMRAQDDLSRSVLEGETAAAFAERIRELWSLASFGLPVEAGGRLFYTRNDGGSQQAVLRVRPVGSHEQGRVEGDGAGASADTLVDPNREPRLAGRRLAGFVPSRDGALVAVGHAEGGSQWSTWEVVDAASGRRLGNELTGLVRASVAWLADGSGFFYTRQDEVPDAAAARTATLGRESVHFHAVGTPQTEDRRVFPADGDGEDLNYTLTMSDGGDRLVISERRPGDVRSKLWLANLAGWTKGQPLRPRPLAGDHSSAWAFLGEGDGGLILHTDHDAPNGRLVLVAPDGSVRDLVAEADDSIVFAHQVDHRLLVVYSQDAVPRVEVHGEDGAHQRTLELPQLAYLGSFSGRRDDRHAFYRLSGLTDPGTVYRLDPESGESRVFLRGELPFRPEDYVTEQHFAASADGTRVPLFVARRRDLPARGGHPTMLYGYGAWGWSAFPWFQPEVLAWMEAGGAYALANVRGGGEYGETWHRAGIVRRKQNAIDDFLAVAEWLVDEGFTSRDRLAARGGSASGPLAGAAVVQRPDLFGAALIDIPALDMLRFNAFTRGKAWEPEFGRPDHPTDPGDFRALHAYSPYHNLRDGTCYPATLVTAGELDEVTVPSHAYKFVAAAQHVQRRTAGCDEPVLLQIAWGSGHALGADRDRSIASMSRMLAFLERQIGG